MAFLQIQEPLAPPPHRLAVGIDLGTTHSLVAYEKAGKMEILSDENGQVLLPSVVRYFKDQPVVVGEAAKKYLVDDPQNTIASVKRLMGKSPKEVLSTGMTLPY